MANRKDLNQPVHMHRLIKSSLFAYTDSTGLPLKIKNVDYSAQADSHRTSHLAKTHFLVYVTFLYVSQFHHMGRTVCKPYEILLCT